MTIADPYMRNQPTRTSSAGITRLWTDRRPSTPSGPCACPPPSRWSSGCRSSQPLLSLTLSLFSFRVGVLLTRGESSPPVVAKAGYIGDGTGLSWSRCRSRWRSRTALTAPCTPALPVGVTLYRADAAAWLVKELAERKWVGELMVISS
jgi:hypothetical protein